MRLATFNICSGRSANGQVDVARFADAVTALDADILALQEVDRDQERSTGANLTEVAASAMGAPHHLFAPSLYGTPGVRWTAAGARAQDGPAYGCALLSRSALHDVQIIRMPALPIALPMWAPGAGPVLVREEPRVAIVARVDTARSGFTVVSTHLPFVPVWNARQLRAVAQQIATRPGPVLLLGDLNMRTGRPTAVTGYRSLAQAPTFPSNRPRVQLDYVLLRGSLHELGPVTGTSTPMLGVSDHRPLVVDLDLGPRDGGRH